MPDHKNTVDEARKLLEDRRTQLNEELKDLEKAISALGGRASRGAKSAVGRATGRRGPQAASPAKGSGRQRRRRRKGGTRSEQAVKLLTDNPGLTASEIATRLGIKPNYMYRVLSDLQGEKLIRKDGRKYYATGASGSSSTK